MSPGLVVQVSPNTPPMIWRRRRAKIHGRPGRRPCPVGSPAFVRSLTPKRQVSSRVRRVPAGASKIQLPPVRNGALPFTVDDRTRSCDGHWSHDLVRAGVGRVRREGGRLRPPGPVHAARTRRAARHHVIRPRPRRRRTGRSRGQPDQHRCQPPHPCSHRAGMYSSGGVITAARVRPRMAAGTETLKRTPLHDRHAAAGARLVPFAGWEMPVQYAGSAPSTSRCARRSACSTSATWARSRRAGRTREAFLQRILSNDVSRSPRTARSTPCSARTTAACSTTSSPTASARERFLTVTNASNHEKDLAWFKRHAERLRRRRPRPPARLRDARGPGARRPAHSSRSWRTASSRSGSAPPP